MLTITDDDTSVFRDDEGGSSAGTARGSSHRRRWFPPPTTDLLRSRIDALEVGLRRSVADVQSTEERGLRLEEYREVLVRVDPRGR